MDRSSQARTLPQALQYWWSTRSGFAVDSWRLEFAVFADGQVVGFQGMGAVDFRKQRQVETGSWLGLAHQGRGFGKEMRAAIVAFAFDQLDAEWVTSTAYPDNVASNHVSLATGYEPDGIDIVLRRGNVPCPSGIGSAAPGGTTSGRTSR